VRNLIENARGVINNVGVLDELAIQYGGTGNGAFNNAILRLFYCGGNGSQATAVDRFVSCNLTDHISRRSESFE
jgi:hypothetical protein